MTTQRLLARLLRQYRKALAQGDLVSQATLWSRIADIIRADHAARLDRAFGPQS